MDDSKPMGRAQGFTLVEALLTITIGAILLASGTVMYQQYRQSAGNSSAMDRVMALQSTVETTYATNNLTYPSLSLLSAAWQARRPNDFAVSPWGGLAASAGVPVTAGSLIGGGDQPQLDGNNCVTTLPKAGDSGLLYYWQNPAHNGTIGAYDQAGGGSSQAIYRNYVVTIVPNNQSTPQYWFVRGGAIASSSTGNSFVGVGAPAPSPLF